MPETVLTLDAALDGCSAAIVRDGKVLIAQARPGGRGSAALLPSLAAEVLTAARITARNLTSIAVTVGPGSFTGVRAALALAQGIGLAAGIPVTGVTVGDAIRASLGPIKRPIWIAIDTRRGRIFLDRSEQIAALNLEALPAPDAPIAVSGDAAISVASSLLARGCNIQLLLKHTVEPAGIAAAALIHPRPAFPFYIDPPEARPNPAGRPPPAA